MNKKLLISVILCFFVFFSGMFAQEVIERYRLGNYIEDITYISTGGLAGKCAFVDGWHVYIFDLDTGGYEKLFYYGDLNIKIPARGIAYISTGVYSGNFLMNDTSNTDTLFIVTPSGDLVSEVKAVDFTWEMHCEGITEITSGPYQGFFAMNAFPSNNEDPHIYIFSIQVGGGTVNAHLIKDIIILSNDSWPHQVGSYSICFLDNTYPDPEFRNHFVLFNVQNSRLGVFDDEGNLETSFLLEQFNYEGLAYINTGPYQGKLMVADIFAEDTWVMNLDGTEKIPHDVHVGLGIGLNISSLAWLESTDQFMINRLWSLLQREFYFISRLGPESWRKDYELTYPDLQVCWDITQLTPDGMYYLVGRDRIEHQYFYKVHKVDSNFSLIAEYQLNKWFSILSYVPGEIRIDDKFAMVSPTERTKVYMFDSIFTNPEEIDLSEQVEGILDMDYDSVKERYYVLEYESLLHIFDSSWNVIAEYDLSPFVPRRFNGLTKITTGDLKGNIALINPDDVEIVIINLEPQIINSQIENLIEEVQIREIHQGVQISLIRQLENVKSSIEKEDINAAIHQMLALQHEVQAQSDKKIPVDLAERWIDISKDIIQALEDL